AAAEPTTTAPSATAAEWSRPTWAAGMPAPEPPRPTPNAGPTNWPPIGRPSLPSPPPRRPRHSPAATNGSVTFSWKPPCWLPTFGARGGTAGGSGVTDDTNSPPPAESPLVAELRDLVERANRGEAAALPRLRAVLDVHPEVWQTVG